MSFIWSSTLKSSDATITNDGKTVSIKGGWAVSQEDMTSGKHYFEFIINTYSQIVIGISQSITTATKPSDNQIRAMYGYDGNKIYPRSAYGTSYNATNTIGIAIDMDKGEISFTKDGVDLGVAFNNLKELDKIKLYMSTSTTGGNETLTIVDDIKKMKHPDVAKKFLYDNGLILQNSLTNKYYSLSDKTLIHPPNASNRNMLSYGIEQGKEIQLDVPFTKHIYVNDTPVGKVFTQGIESSNTLQMKEIKKEEYTPIFTWKETSMTSNTTPAPFIVSASDQQSGFEAYKAFNTLSGSSDTWMTNSNIVNGWIQLDLGSSMVFNCVRITSRNGVGYDTHSPKDFEILASNDNDTFTKLGTFNSNTAWKNYEQRLFTFNNTTAYRYYRVNVLSNNGGVIVAINNITFGYKREVN